MLMPGDGRNPLKNPLVIHLFRQDLVHQALWLILAAAAVAMFLLWRQLRSAPLADLEPRARTYLRWGFGVLWVIDGLLQFQPAMPIGLANDVVAPSTVGAPYWLHSMVLDAVGIWNRHPLVLATATAWIQLGLGLLMICARGGFSRVVGLMSAGWALVIWTVGNSFGGIFSTSSSFLFGWPGASAFYFAAGVWLALSPKVFPERFSIVTLRIVAVMLGVAIIVQAWPDHGFWQGGSTNPLTAMTTSMTQSAQPRWLSSVVRHSGLIGQQLGGGLNIIVILWLAICAVGLWRSATRQLVWPLVTFVVGCTVIWLVAQDAAIFGGLSTDLNSMVPLALLVWWAAPQRRNPAPRTRRLPELKIDGFTIAGRALGLCMVAFAIVPMMLATASDVVETTLFFSHNAPYSLVSGPAWSFSLTNQNSRVVDFPFHDGRYAVLTFLDPRCWTDCPLLAHQLEDLNRALTPEERRGVRFVAVAADPFHEKVSDLRTFIRKNDLHQLKRFDFVTGPLVKVQAVWYDYGVRVTMTHTDAMSVHSDVVYVISPKGQLAAIVPDDPAPGWSGEQSSTVVLLQALHASGLR